MKTLPELIEFLESIPEKEWCGYQFEILRSDGIQRCVAGHINHKLSGDAWPKGASSKEPCTLLMMELGIPRWELVGINNRAAEKGCPKGTVIEFLRTKLKEVV